MKSFTQRDIKSLFSNFCCSYCRNDFSVESFSVKEEYGDLLVCNLKCEKCGKDFGDIVFNFNRLAKTHKALEVIDGPEPISVDDVIDAHEFIKKNL